MRTRYLQCTFVAFILMLAQHAHGLPGESIVLDPNTGNYTITYLGYDESGESEERTALRVATFEPATKIDPTIRSTLKMGTNGIVAYRYRVHNGATSRQPLVMIVFDPVSSLVTTDSATQPELNMQPNATAQNWGVASYPMNVPEGWNGWVTTSRIGGVRAGWDSSDDGLAPGGVPNNFGFFSGDLPGIGVVQLKGDSAIRKFVDEGPIGEVGEQLGRLVQNDYVPRNAAVPTIAVPSPFDPAALLERIRAHVATWPGKQLVDPAYAAQLDRYLVASAEAYRLSNAKAGREHIETLRRMLAKEHHYLDHDEEDSDDAEERKAQTRFAIDRLAARVLDFDLRYVLKQMERDHEEDHEKRER